MLPRGCRTLALCLAVFILTLVSSCRQAEEAELDETAGPVDVSSSSPFDSWVLGQTPDEVAAKVGEVLEKSRSLTELEARPTSSDDTLPHRKVRPFELIGRKPNPVPKLREDSPPPIGEIVSRDPNETHSLAVGNDGTIYQSTVAGVMAWELDGSAQGISDLVALQLQLDALGEQLLIHARGETLILSGDGFADQRVLPENLPGEKFGFLGPDELLITHETIDFSAASRQRIMLESFRYNLADSTWVDSGWGTSGRFSAVGTLPAQSVVWGHRISPYLIDAMPAPLVAISDGELTGYLTRTSEAADIQPSGDRLGRIYWVRTRGRGTKTGRAFYRSVDDKNFAGVQLTGYPTYHVAVSPNGEHGAFVILRDGEFELWRFRSAALETETSTFAIYRNQDEAFRVKALTALEDLRAALVGAAGPTPTSETDYGLILNQPPSLQTVDAMSAALKRVVLEHFGFSLRADLTGLGELDSLLDQLDTYWPEEPATALAIGGFFAEAFPPEAKWELDTSTVYASLSFDDVSNDTDLGYSVIMPFAIARERLSNQRPLAARAGKLARELPRPIYYTENLSPKTVDKLLMNEYQRAGLSGKQAQVKTLFDQLSNMEPPNAALADLAHRQAKAIKHAELKLYTAWHLANARPESGVALKELGDALWESYHSEAAIEVLREAVMLQPEDMHIRLAYADSLFATNQLDEAEKELGRVSLLDRSAVLDADIRARLRLIDESRESSQP